MTMEDQGMASGSVLPEARDATRVLPPVRHLSLPTALALGLGGANPGFFLLAVVLTGPAVWPVLAIALLLSCVLAPGWLHLALTRTRYTGSFAASCAALYRPRHPLLASLAGMSYWWAWLPFVGLTAWLMATLLQASVLPMLSLPLLTALCLATGTLVSLAGLRLAGRLAVALCIGSIVLFKAALAPASATHFVPLLPGFNGSTPLAGLLGLLLTAGHFAPAFEATTACADTLAQPRRMLPVLLCGGLFAASISLLMLTALMPTGQAAVTSLDALLAAVTRYPGYGVFVVTGLALTLLQALNAPCRILAQLADDALLPRWLAWRTAGGVPWAALFTHVAAASLFLLAGRPMAFFAASTLCYFVCLCLGSVAVRRLLHTAPASHLLHLTATAGIGVSVLGGLIGLASVGVLGVGALTLAGAMLAIGPLLYHLNHAPRQPQQPVAAAAPARTIEPAPVPSSDTVLNDRRLALIMQAAPPLGTYEWDLRSGRMQCSETLCRLMGWPAGQPMVRQDDLESQVHPEDLPLLRQAIRQALAGDGKLHAEYRIIWPNGEIRWIRDQAEAAVDAAGRIHAFSGILFDLTEQKTHAQRLAYLAQHDQLTGLPNRHLFLERLGQAMAEARRHGSLVALMYLDFDRFKEINDSLGHETGDRVLNICAARIRQCVRPTDTIARLGGDEFSILMENVAHIEVVQMVAQQLIETFALPVEYEGMAFYLTASIGIALCPTDDDQVEGLLKKADRAMYQAKEAGRNNYQFFIPAISAQATERLNMKNQLRQAIERDELHLLFQPKVELRSGQIIGAEALVRWRHPEHGLIPPATFIPVAEDSGLIIQIGESVLRMACRQNRAWQDAGLPRIPVAVNLSALQFRQKHFLQTIESILQETGLAAHYLELELTESVLMQNVSDIILTLGELKAMGVGLSIDDFGTGYSSLSYLKRFPVDTLKIDRSFVRDISTDPDDAAITSTIINMAHSLRLKVVAEGVESEDQLAFLAAHDCNEVQGYYFSEPLPEEDFKRLLVQGFGPVMRQFRLDSSLS